MKKSKQSEAHTIPSSLKPRQNKLNAAFLLSASLVISFLSSSVVKAETQQSQQVQAFSIASGGLSTVLRQFASQAKITLSFDPALVSGKQSRGLKGQYSIETGLQQLLAGHGLQIITIDGESYRLESRSSSDKVELPKVSVSGDYINETGLGAVSGYVAKRSITAAKSDIPLIETPQSVSIVTADQIAIQNAESLHQALKYTPGIVPMGSDNTTSDGMIIRGFNVTGSAPMYLNGTKLSRNTFSGVSEPYAMERIEILKGPASVLYGNAAPGGIVNMVTKQPQADTLRELKVQAGSFDRKQLAGDFAGALTDDGSLTYRVTGLVRRSDTMTDYIPDDREFVQGSVRWEPTENTSLTLLANYQNNEIGYVYGLPEIGTVSDNINGNINRDRFIGEPDFDKYDARNYTLGYFLNHEINDQITFRQNFLHFGADTDWNYLTASGLDASQQLLSRGAASRADENSSWSIDNQLEFKWDLGATQHTSLMGLDYTEQTFERVQYRGSVGDLNLFNPIYGSAVTLNSIPASHSKQDSKQLGIYAQEHIKIADKWVVMLGGRYDKVQSDTKNRLTNVSTENYDDDAFTGRAGLVYLFDNGFAPYISYSESFEAPPGGEDANGSAFKPTEGEQYEIGLRYQPEGQAISITASVYKLTQKNVMTSDLNNPDFSIQEGEVESKGFELEAKANLTNNLNLIASYGYIDNAVTESNSGTEGNRYGAVPRHMASLWADYKFSETIPGLGLGAGVRYYGRSYNLANTYDVPGFTVVDAVVNYSLTPEWSLALNINNLFDEEYATCSYACFYGVERSATVSASYNW
ncbi:MAG: TonB-dependent siderophore receptor [Methylophaga sp.]|uniref:TonB-dependent siderophore receptor n=1 Tax=Methylophaga sp. UBA678 TaxID=1946901 RepID=UPI000C65C5B4|nr:TonB-dependent siderophore receptor [Methylophaga sp. UBA678]MAX53883.1 TonB-dependent siderophore receptor [Methylophaga sp.]|tara:strand:+ start:44579 stop:47008 length:2430 start_codon:yes stop_codon:yes gene_type:complete